MKQIFTFLALSFSYMLCGAQATSLVVDNQTPGWLSSKINYSDQQTVENLTLTGYVNQTDISFISSLMEKHSLNGHLDMTNAEIVDVEYSNSPTSVGTLNMFTLSKVVNIKRLSLPLGLTEVSPYLLAKVKSDTLDYGSSHCQILSKFLVTNRYYSTNYAPKVLYLREGMTKIQTFGTDEGNEKTLHTIVLPLSIDSIGNNAFKGCSNLESVNLSDNIHTIGEYAFAETSLLPDTLKLPKSLKIFYVNAFPVQNGQTVIIGENVERINNTNSDLTRYSTLTYVINRITPPQFVKKYGPDAVDLECCTLYVPKAGYSMYKDPNYKLSNYSGTNPYSFATVKVISIPVSGLSLNYSSEVLGVGRLLKLIATVTPNDADNLNVQWSTSNDNIAIVDNDGLVTALSSGKATIKAQSSENPKIFATCEITVHQPLESIALNTSTINLKVGEEYRELKVSFVPTTADNKKVTFTSSNPLIASIDENGIVKAIGKGVTSIIVTSVENPAIKAECSVTVNQPATGISLNKSVLELIEEESEQLIATVFPENASNKSLNWTSSDISVAMVSPDGTVYAIKPGQATIMATTVDGGFVALCKVTVKAKVVVAESISLSTTTASLTVGETLQLSANILPENTSNKDICWTSTNTDIAVVSESGLVSAIKEGDVQIIASTTDGSNLSAICEISVNSQFVSITQIAISPSSVRLAVGETFNLEAQITPADATNKTINWSSTNSSVVTVDSYGQLTAKGVGSATIIASSQDGTNISATCNIEVFEPSVPISSITIVPVDITGKVGETYQLTATITPENASEKTLVWSSDNSTVASVESDGLISLHTKGNAVIKATASDGSGISATCAVVVEEGAGINDIEIDGNQFVRIYNLQGVLIYEGEYSEAHLHSSTYIILANGHSIKRVIR